MSGEVLRFSDYEKRQAYPREPEQLDCVVILPVVRVERHLKAMIEKGKPR